MKLKTRMILLSICAAGLLAAAICLALVYFNRWSLDLTLEGKREITLEYGQRYEEPGARAHFSGSIFQRKGVDVPVEIIGAVDSNHLGTYTLEYAANWQGTESRQTRTVTVVDTIPPEITLAYTEGSYTLPGQPYQEEGYAASDNCDGDLTAQVTSYEEGGVVYYTVSDASGNTASAQRAIVYNDPVPPELVLAGASEMVISAGSGYIEPGYSAVDNVDGDLTAAVTVEGEVNPNKAGAYYLVYTVSDSYGNVAQAARTVTVQAVQPQQETSAVPKDRVVYLTFDDGPGPYTRQLLDVLDKYNVKATFFVTNCHPDYQNMIAQEAAAGHAIGIHSYTHDYAGIYTSDAAFFADLNAMNEIIAAQTGSYTNLMRFPGGSSNLVSKKYCPGIMTALAQEVTDQGYVYFDWNVSSGDAGATTDTATVAANVISGIQSHKVSVVLQHDIKGFSVDAVEQIIQWGLDNGYTFLPLTASTTPVHHGIGN